MTSLVDRVDSFAIRVAEEFNAVRTEIAGISTVDGFSNIDGGTPTSVFTVSQARFDGGGP